MCTDVWVTRDISNISNKKTIPGNIDSVVYWYQFSSNSTITIVNDWWWCCDIFANTLTKANILC